MIKFIIITQRIVDASLIDQVVHYIYVQECLKND